LRDPDQFKADSFRRVARKHEGKAYSVIMGRLKDEDAMTEQAYRYDRDIWTASEARGHCEDHDGSFEPASEVDVLSIQLENREVRTLHDWRSVHMPELRVIEDADAGQSVIEGYAAVFGQWSENLGGFVELIRPGAFTKTIQEADVRALWNHNAEQVLGRTKNRTLELSEDALGLRYRLRPPDTQAGRDAVASIRRGDVDQSSFGFETIRDEWSDEEVVGGWLYRRELIEVKLYDVSPVTFPAYPQTSVAVRAKIRSHAECLPAQAGGNEGNEGNEGRTSAPGQAPHPENEADQAAARARLELARRRIEIAEKEL